MPMDAPNPQGTNRQRAAFAFLHKNSSRVLKIAVENEMVENRQTRRARERGQK